jgi:lysozyme family protein
MAAPSFTTLAKEYRAKWNNIKFTRSTTSDEWARRILKLKSRYQVVEKKTGVPWWWIAVTHMRESSCNFAGVLHNGEHIIGTGRKTRLVPAGRGPFTSWEEAAVDAIKLKGLHKIADWSIERALYEFERFNGFGYHWKRQPSPYVWAGTTFYKSGKYVRDGVYDPSHVDTQMGCAAVCKSLEGFGVVVDRKPVASPKPKPLPIPDDRPSPNAEDPDEKPAVKSKTIWASILGVITSIGGILTDWRVALIIVVALFLFIAADRFLKWDIKGWFRS